MNVPQFHKLPKLSKKAITGLVFIYVAGIGWAAEFIIPFIHLPNKVATFTVVLVLAELSFVIGVTLLGKAYYKDMKAKLIAFLRNPK